jgi:phage protein U
LQVIVLNAQDELMLSGCIFSCGGEAGGGRGETTLDMLGIMAERGDSCCEAEKTKKSGPSV